MSSRWGDKGVPCPAQDTEQKGNIHGRTTGGTHLCTKNPRGCLQPGKVGRGKERQSPPPPTQARLPHCDLVSFNYAAMTIQNVFVSPWCHFATPSALLASMAFRRGKTDLFPNKEWKPREARGTVWFVLPSVKELDLNPALSELQDSSLSLHCVTCLDQRLGLKRCHEEWTPSLQPRPS